MKTNGNEPINVVATKNTTINSNGLTKREYFAAMAMQGLIAQTPEPVSARALANEAVIVADALIAELNKEKPK